MDIKEEHNEFFHELDGRGFIFQNKKWLGGCFEDDQLQVVWEMWQAKAQAVLEGFALVKMDDLELLRDSTLKIKYASLNNDSDRIFSDIEDIQLSIERLIELQELTND